MLSWDGQAEPSPPSNQRHARTVCEHGTTSSRDLLVIGTAGLLWESVAWASVTLLSLQFHDPGIQYERLQMSHMLTGSSLIYAGVAMSD